MFYGVLQVLAFVGVFFGAVPMFIQQSADKPNSIDSCSLQLVLAELALYLLFNRLLRIRISWLRWAVWLGILVGNSYYHSAESQELSLWTFAVHGYAWTLKLIVPVVLMLIESVLTVTCIDAAGHYCMRQIRELDTGPASLYKVVIIVLMIVSVLLMAQLGLHMDMINRDPYDVPLTALAFGIWTILTIWNIMHDHRIISDMALVAFYLLFNIALATFTGEQSSETMASSYWFMAVYNMTSWKVWAVVLFRLLVFPIGTELIHRIKDDYDDRTQPMTTVTTIIQEFMRTLVLVAWTQSYLSQENIGEDYSPVLRWINVYLALTMYACVLYTATEEDEDIWEDALFRNKDGEESDEE